MRPTSDVKWLQGCDVELVVGDVKERASVDRAVRGCRYVVHAAGKFRFWGPTRQFERNNVQGTANVCEAVARFGAERLVHISTVAVAGAPRRGCVIDEAYPCQPADAYQRSKYDGELVVRMYHLSTGIPAIILRPGAFYGPHSHYGFNRLFFDDPFRGLRIQIHHGQRLTFPVYVPDVVQAIISSLECGRVGEVYNVSGRSLRHREVNDIVSRLAGISSFRVNCPAPLMLAIARAGALLAGRTQREPFYPLNLATYVFYDWHVSSEKAQRELGFTATSFADGARVTVDWYREIGLLT